MAYLFVLHTLKTGPSGRRLAREIGTLLAGVKGAPAVHVGTEKRLAVTLRKLRSKPTLVLNVGETALPKSLEGVKVYNEPSLVARSSNKRGCRILFRDNDVPAPELWLAPAAVPASAYPVVGRTTHHSKAQGFWFCKNKTEADRAVKQGATHFLKFIKNTMEFRVHVFAVDSGSTVKEDNFRSVKLSQKVPRDDSVSNDAIIKNHDSGWVFNYTGGKTREASTARAAAKKAMAAAGLDWGAVDVMVSKDDGKAYVLEINSAPCLTDETADTAAVYASWALHLCGLKKKDVATPKPAPVAPVWTKPVVAKAPPPPAKPRRKRADALKSLLARMK